MHAHCNSVFDGKWYGISKRNGEKSPGQNEQEYLYYKNGDRDNIIRAHIPV